MKLERLKVCGIRGFNFERELFFEDGLTVVYGPNGEGKTSFVEAIEWLLFGTIIKIEKAYSKTEFKDSIKNIHFSGETPFVEAILSHDGKKINLKRIYLSEKSSKLYRDGIEDSKERISYLNPIIYQHGLKTFIHTEPRNRYIEFMKLLNIEEIDTFIKILQKFENECKEHKENTQIIDSILFVRKIWELLPNLCQNIIAKDLDRLATANIINEDLKLKEENIDNENYNDFIESINRIIYKTKNNLFDLDSFSNILNFEEIDFSSIINIKELEEAVVFLSDNEIMPSVKIINLLENGLEIIKQSNMAKCPLCFENTIDKEKISSIDRALNDYKEKKIHIAKNKEVIKKYYEIFLDFKQSLSLVLNISLSEDTIASIKKFDIDRSLFEKMLEDNNKILPKSQIIKGALVDLKETLDALQKDEINIVNKFEDYKQKLNSLKNNTIELFRDMDSLKITMSKIVDILLSRVSANEEIIKLETINNILTNFNHFTIYKINLEIEKEISEGIVKFKKFRDEVLDRAIKAQKTDIINWYNNLNPNEEIKICDIESQKTTINFIASSYGVRGNAVPILSEAHLNCLGLSIYLSQIVNKNNPFSFIIIDDPVQSMDEVHTDTFINYVIDTLIKKEYQIFVLSHLKSSVSDSIIKRYRDELPNYLEFYGYNLEGPQIKINKKDRFLEYISLAEQNYNGDSTQRQMAANMIRHAVETYSKEYYCKKSGKSLPDGCKRASYKKLEDELFSRISIDSSEKGKLRMINNKCDIGSHDDEIFEPPSSSALRSYIDTLKGFYKKHISTE